MSARGENAEGYVGIFTRRKLSRASPGKRKASSQPVFATLNVRPSGWITRSFCLDNMIPFFHPELVHLQVSVNRMREKDFVVVVY